MGNLVLELRKVVAMFVECRDTFTGTVSSLTQEVFTRAKSEILHVKEHKGDTTTEDTKAPEGGRGSGADPPRPEVTTREEEGDPTDQAGPTGVDRIIPTHTHRTVANSHA